nr:chromodomain-helicase-DNA-binding protein 3-like isoform X4 [Tanacetum cinerariifolium]
MPLSARDLGEKRARLGFAYLDRAKHHLEELILTDECQRPVVATYFQNIKMLEADMKLVSVTDETVDVSQKFPIMPLSARDLGEKRARLGFGGMF